MSGIRIGLAAMAALWLSACASTGPVPGTPEFAAVQVSRGYDCGLRIDRARIMARLDRQEQARFLAASRSLAVKSYKAPRRCEAGERTAMQRALGALGRR